MRLEINMDVKLPKFYDSTYEDALKMVGEYLEANRRFIAHGATLRISLLKEKEGRAGKRETLSLLRYLVSQLPESERKWAMGSLVLDFDKMEYRDYRIHGEAQELHLTAQEQLVLFQLLMLRKSPDTVPHYYQITSRLCHKFGDNFMERLHV